MLTRRDVISVLLDIEEVDLIFEMAEAIPDDLFYHSDIYGVPDQKRYRADSIAGQVGEYVLLKVLFPDGRERYLDQRAQRNADPYNGDGGSDIAGGNLDVKTSVMRYQRPIREYHLLVMEKDYKPHCVYALVLVSGNGATRGEIVRGRPLVAYLCGWARGDSLVRLEEFPGRWGQKAGLLMPFPPLKWESVA